LKEAAAHTAEYQAKLKALQEQLQGLKNDDAFYVAATGAHDKDTQAKAIGVQSQIDALNNRAHIQNLTDAQATLSTTWTGMVDSVFDELIKKSQSTQDQLKTIALKLVDDLNTQLAKGMTSNGKMDFHAAFASAAQSAAKSSLEKAEGLGLKALGLGSKDKLGTKGNPMIVKMADAAAGEVGKVGKGLMGMLNDSDWASSLFGGKLFGSNSFFGGHALGGPAMAGLPIPVGELGPETFTPSTPGYITPHNQVSSGGPSIGYIDARGTDPVQTQMAVTRGMQLAHSHAVRDAQTAMADRARRRPQ